MDKPLQKDTSQIDRCYEADGLHSPTKRWKLGLFLTLIAALLLGILPTALKVLVNEVDAYSIAWIRLIACFGILFAVLSFKGDLPKFTAFGRQQLVLLIVASLALSTNYATYVLGLRFIDPGPSQLLIQLSSVFIILGGVIVYKEKFTSLQILGLILILAGLVAFFGGKINELLDSYSQYKIGVYILILSAGALAIYILAQRQLLLNFSSMQISLMVFGFGSLVVLPVAMDGMPTVGELSWSGVALLFFCVLGTLGAFGSYAEALQHWETTKIGAVMSTVPLIAFGFAEVAVIFSPGAFSTEPVTNLGIVGALILVVGSCLIVGKQKRKRTP